MSLDESGIDHRHCVAGVGEGLGGVLPVDAGRFQADRGGSSAFLAEPVGQRRMALRGIGDGFGDEFTFLASVDQERGV